MFIKQLSVFIENKDGRLAEITAIIANAGIDIRAISISDTTDFGILRLIVNEVEKAVEVLRNADFAVMLTDVVCISCPNVAGSLSVILEKLAENDIFIEYMYAFAEGDKANVVIRPNNITECCKVLENCDCTIRN
jgi:hypothetical protein